MNFLCDTHAFLWFAGGDSRLRQDQREALEDTGNIIFLSSVSSTEIAIKHSIGKLPLPESPEIYVPRLRERVQFSELPLDERASLRLATLPLLHRDPFDRLLICQALTLEITIVTSDSHVRQYDVPTL
ncbi:MAG: type II toxin-antitoxin system VapC family toxin [Chthoniobacterales bacterium]